MFVCGDPNGDNGHTGKKLAMDACGPTVPIGVGACRGWGVQPAHPGLRDRIRACGTRTHDAGALAPSAGWRLARQGRAANAQALKKEIAGLLALADRSLADAGIGGAPAIPSTRPCAWFSAGGKASLSALQ